MAAPGGRLLRRATAPCVVSMSVASTRLHGVTAFGPESSHNPALTVAWRIRRLERDTELRELERRGVPVVAWHGPGSLDRILRDLGRRSGAPRMARR